MCLYAEGLYLDMMLMPHILPGVDMCVWRWWCEGSWLCRMAGTYHTIQLPCTNTLTQINEHDDDDKLPQYIDTYMLHIFFFFISEYTLFTRIVVLSRARRKKKKSSKWNLSCIIMRNKIIVVCLYSPAHAKWSENLSGSWCASKGWMGRKYNIYDTEKILLWLFQPPLRPLSTVVFAKREYVSASGCRALDTHKYRPKNK